MNTETEHTDDHPIAKFLRLNNGDDIVCELIELADDDSLMYMVVNPVKVMYVPTSKAGFVQIALVPWVFPRITDHHEFTIDPKDVLLVTDVSSKLNRYYWENLEEFMSYTNFGEMDDEPEEEPQEESKTDLPEELLEILKNARRTFH